MDALSLIPEHARSDAFWVGKLSMAVALAYNRPQDARHILKPTLDDFLRSPLPSSELRDMLTKEMGR